MTPIEIFEKVDAFYRTSWDHLLIFGSVLGLVIGLIVPLLLTLYQRRLFKLEESAVTQTVKIQVEQAKSALAEAYKQDLASIRSEMEANAAAITKKVDDALALLRTEHTAEFATMKERLDRDAARLTGAVFHVQGAMLAEQKSYIGAMDSLLDAALSQARAEDELNLGRTTRVITEDLLPNFTKSLLSGWPGDFVARLERLEEVLSDLDKRGRWQDRIVDLRTAKEQALAREKPTAVAPTAPPAAA
ncbi:hypothetical protein ACOQFB_18495 [Anaeromyxobacter sp. Red801]|uniref:hypothetical protein n=1 Tax=Anaeromyxobacter sp. Red801 TaxID=3411632 RepID=UPI003BA05A02